jgi:enoyl-CoA hydratase/carnithine racemase
VSSLNLQIEPPFALLTIDQPNIKANVLSREFLGELSQTLDHLEGQSGLKGFICRSGKPGMFIAGADLKELGEGTIAGDTAVDFAREGQGIYCRLERLPYPTACIVEGPALGGGLEFVLCFDACVAVEHPKTQLGLPETKLGLIPGWGGTQRLPRWVGLDEAVRMMLSGEGLSPHQAARWVDRVGPPDLALIHAQTLIEELHQGAAWQKRRDARYGMMVPAPRHATALQTLHAARASLPQHAEAASHAKSVLLDLLERTLALDLLSGLEEEAKAFGQVAGTAQSQELIAAFFAARAKPKG